jgi:hypothetical protein
MLIITMMTMLIIIIIIIIIIIESVQSENRLLSFAGNTLVSRPSPPDTRTV